MLALKKGEFTSLQRYSNVIFVFSAVIAICLLNACIKSSAATDAELSFAPEHIEKSCIEKCPDQVSVLLFSLVCQKIKTIEKMNTLFQNEGLLFFGSSSGPRCELSNTMANSLEKKSTQSYGPLRTRMQWEKTSRCLCLFRLYTSEWKQILSPSLCSESLFVCLFTSNWFN